MQTLVRLGKSTPNIITDYGATWGQFELSSGWTSLTSRLGLPNVQQTYFIWLWLDTAYNLTFARVQDGGSMQTGLINNLASQAFEDSVAIMQLELPMFTLASQLNISYAYNVTYN